MTIVRLEVLKQEDVELIIKLAERLQLSKIDIFDDDHPIFGLPMSEEELTNHLENVVNEEGMSLEQFKKNLSEKWK